MQRLHVGIVAPQTYGVQFTSTADVLDLSTVSAGTFEITKPDGTTTSWATTLSAQTSTALTLTYSFGATTPLDMPGTWRFRAKFTVPGGYRWSEDWVEQVDKQ